VTMVSDCVSPD